MNSSFLKALTLIFLPALANAADLDISSAGQSNAEATKLLYRFAEDIGSDVSRPKPDGEFFALNQDGVKMLIDVKAASSGVDRAVARIFFTGKKEHANSVDMHKLLAKLNRTYNTCTISIDSDGDVCFLFVLSFDNRVSPKLFRLWCEHVSQCTQTIISNEPELRKNF